MPVFLVSILTTIGGLVGWKAHAAVDNPPASLPSGNTSTKLDLTTIAGYAIVGGLILYFGNKVFNK